MVSTRAMSNLEAESKAESSVVKSRPAATKATIDNKVSEKFTAAKVVKGSPKVTKIKAKAAAKGNKTKFDKAKVKPTIKRKKPKDTRSSLQKLPRELRERIYFFLGVPVGGKVLHDCNIMSKVVDDYYEVMEEDDTEYSENPYGASLPIDDTILLEVDDVSEWPGLTDGPWEITGTDPEGDSRFSEHNFIRLPHPELLEVNEFFRNDILACADYWFESFA